MKVIAHRGITSDNIRENSYLAIKRALKDKNIDGVELDIRMTKDKKIVLNHGSNIGFNYIENMNYIDIIKEKYITTLDKVLSINTDKILFIDIKVNHNYKKFADLIIKELSLTNKNIYLASFNKNIIKYLKRKTKHKVGLISFYYRRNSFKFCALNYISVSSKKLGKITKEIFLWTINKNNLQYVKNKFLKLDSYNLIMDIKRDD